MQKKILITGATDGIGLVTAKELASQDHHLLIHGRNKKKLEQVERDIASLSGSGTVETYVADLSVMDEVETLAQRVSEVHRSLDVIINNAGVYMVPETVTGNGLDVRFAVNTIAPYLLTKRLLPLLDSTGRVVNLASAAQAPVDPDALRGKRQLTDGEAYAQSKLAIIMWSRVLAHSLKKDGPLVVSVNPGSLLGSKMVKEAFGMEGKDLSIGADILCRAALSEEFADASGEYFDNDAGSFNSPHPDALKKSTAQEITQIIETILTELGHTM